MLILNIQTHILFMPILSKVHWSPSGFEILCLALGFAFVRSALYSINRALWELDIFFARKHTMSPENLHSFFFFFLVNPCKLILFFHLVISLTLCYHYHVLFLFLNIFPLLFPWPHSWSAYYQYRICLVSLKGELENCLAHVRCSHFTVNRTVL